MKTFNELRKEWRLNYSSYKAFIHNFNYLKAENMLNESNVWVLKMILSNNIVITNVQDFRFVTGSAGGSEWQLYKLLLKLSKKDINNLLNSFINKHLSLINSNVITSKNRDHTDII